MEDRQEFNPRGFEQLIAAVLGAGYRVAPFTRDPDLYSTATDSQPVVYMRHDVDFDSHYARSLAEIETNQGVRATYFFQLRSAAYNLLSPPVLDDIESILAGGHRVGLHLDANLYDGDEVGQAVSRELEIFSAYCPDVDLTVISYHRPDRQQILRRESPLAWLHAHTYELRFIGPEDDPWYFTDSGCAWGLHGNPLASDLFSDGRSFQLLLHPIWWIAPGKTADDKLSSLLDQRDAVMRDLTKDWRVEIAFARSIERGLLTLSLDSEGDGIP